MSAEQAAFRHSDLLSSPHIAAPAQQLLSYDELLDARQVARAVQGSWLDQSATDAKLACLWPLKQPIGTQHQSETQLSTSPTQRKAKTAGSAGSPSPELQHHHSRRTAANIEHAQHKRRRQRQHQTAKAQDGQSPKRSLEEATTSASSLDPQQSGPDSSANDSLHTAHFSDEGELSDASDGHTSKRHCPSAKTNPIKKGPVVLYHGPNSEQVAASRAAAKPPPGPRPQLGDVLLEAIHSDDVRSSAKATGVPEEPQARNRWRCIMRRKLPDGQVAECGRDNPWYVPQCVECDAANGATELTSRVSAILQTSGLGQISTRQVMNRLAAFSSSPAGLTHAFTVEMVQQAIDRWVEAQGCKAYQVQGPPAPNDQAVKLDLPIGACHAADHRAATGAKARSNPTIQHCNDLDHPWDHSTSALRQALSTLAASKPATTRQSLTSLPASRLSSATQPATAPADGNAENAELDSQDEMTASVARGSAGQEGADQGRGLTPASGLPKPSEQGAVGQAFHFAHDLLDAVMRQQPKISKASKKRDARAQWALVRRPSAYGRTQGQMHRRVFQLPPLPQQQPQFNTWLKPRTSDLIVHYPDPTPKAARPTPDQTLRPHHSMENQQNLSEEDEGNAKSGSTAGAGEAGANEDEADAPGEEAETNSSDAADEETQQGPSTNAQHDSHMHHTAAVKAAGGGPQACLAEADRAAELDASEDVASLGMAEGPHYRPEGLRPSPAACALAGPTVHMLLEGYDVYKDSGLKRKGNDFPLQEVLHVSQHSRQLWLQQQPFKLRRAMPQDVAAGAHRRGGWRQRQGRKVDTKRTALDRQQAPAPPCNMGLPGHTCAFRRFSSPTISVPDRSVAAVATGSSVGSERHDPAEVIRGYHFRERGHSAVGAQQQQQSVRQVGTAQMQGTDVSASLQPQHDQASGQNAGGQPKGRAPEHGPDQMRAGPSRADLGAAAPTAERLELASESDMLEKFGDMDGDAWKIFCMASRMGLRPEVIEKAAKRFKSLQQHD